MFPGVVSIIVSGFALPCQHMLNEMFPAGGNTRSSRQPKQQPGQTAARRTQHNTTAGQPPTAQIRLHMCAAMARQHHVRAIAAAFRSRGGKGRLTPPHLGARWGSRSLAAQLCRLVHCQPSRPQHRCAQSGCLNRQHVHCCQWHLPAGVGRQPSALLTCQSLRRHCL